MRLGCPMGMLLFVSLSGGIGAAPLSPPRGHGSCVGCHGSHREGQASGLLRESTVAETCLRCHDGVAGIPDVVGDDVNGLADRAGGAFGMGGPSVPSGHVLGTPAEPGARRPRTVACTDCHNPHDRTRPRRLRGPADLEDAAPLGLLLDPEAVGLARYEAAHVAYGADGERLRAVTDLCLDCHPQAADPGGGQGYRRHPAADTQREVTVSQGDLRETTNSRHWVEGTGTGFDVPRLRVLVGSARTYGEARVVSGRNQVFCLTCHKAHGSAHPAGLAWPPNADGSIGPTGCNQCHRKGV